MQSFQCKGCVGWQSVCQGQLRSCHVAVNETDLREDILAEGVAQMVQGIVERAFPARPRLIL